MTKSLGTARMSGLFTYIGYAVFCFFIAAILLEVGSRIALYSYNHLRRHTVADVAIDAPAYSGYPWARDCLDEQTLRLKTRNTYVPFRLWGVTEFHGRCMNNDNTPLGVVRRTTNPSNPACSSGHRTSIWVFGGSTVYGTSIPDWATLPSYLSRQLNTATNCVEVANLGVEGYASNQELLLLLELLKAGRRPDIVILYDGFNDADIGTRPPGSPTPHMGFMGIKGRIEGSMASRLEFIKRSGVWKLVLEMDHSLGRTDPDRVAASEMGSSARHTLDNYEANLSIARVLGKAYGFKVCAFWQPAIIYGKKPMAPYEQELVRLSSDKAYQLQELAPVYREAERRAASSASYAFLGDTFDTVSEPMYLDWVHLNPAGNDLVTRTLANHLKECSD